MSIWYIHDGELPYLKEFPELFEIDDAPSGLWKIKDGELPYRTTFVYMPILDDAPSSLWHMVDGDLPYRTSFVNMEVMGSFCHAEQLQKVTIPKSVKKIGPYAFTHTALKEVTIASDCTYSETTFPKDCVINFYPD